MPRVPGAASAFLICYSAVMGQIRNLSPEQLAYLVRHYTAGWGLEPIAARLPGVGVTSLKYHLSRNKIALKASGGYPKMPTVQPPPFRPSDFRPKHRAKDTPPKPPPDPRVLAWHKPIWPGWRVHDRVRSEKAGTFAGAPVP
jgi:hypothetical protein